MLQQPQLCLEMKRVNRRVFRLIVQFKYTTLNVLCKGKHVNSLYNLETVKSLFCSDVTFVSSGILNVTVVCGPMNVCCCMTE